MEQKKPETLLDKPKALRSWGGFGAEDGDLLWRELRRGWEEAVWPRGGGLRKRLSLAGHHPSV